MSPHPRYPHTFQPLRINRLEAKNRIFMPAHTTNFGAHHLPSERHATYHRMRARELVDFAIRYHPRSDLKRAAELLDLLGVPPERRVGALSHGSTEAAQLQAAMRASRRSM